MSFAQIIPGDFQITDPQWPRVTFWRQGNPFTSDDFSVARNPRDTLTTAALGGQPIAWTAYGSNFEAAGGTLRPPASGSGMLVVNAPKPDLEVSIKIVTLPTAGPVLLMARRDQLDFSTMKNQVRIMIETDGKLTVDHNVNGALSTLIRPTVQAVSGDVVSLQVVGSAVTAKINGAVVGTGTTGATGKGFTGVGSAVSGTNAVLDDFLVTAL